jgi:hypothetical protein
VVAIVPNILSPSLSHEENRNVDPGKEGGAGTYFDSSVEGPHHLPPPADGCRAAAETNYRPSDRPLRAQ